MLAIPALASTRSNPLVTHRLSYRIFCSDQKQYASLSSRLKNVGMKVSQDPSKAEVAFILHRQSDDIQNALARLHHKTTVYLLEHDLAYQKSTGIVSHTLSINQTCCTFLNYNRSPSTSNRRCYSMIPRKIEKF